MPNGQRVTILNSGDITPDGNDSQWQNWQEIVMPFNIDWSEEHPPQYIGAVGNHDAHESGWQDRWAGYLPAQVGLSAYLDIPADSRGLYGSVKYDNALFIWIDSENVPSGQESFLGNTLKKAVQDPEITWRFVFFHHPPIPCGAKDDDAEGKQWHDQYFIPYGVDIVFLGHAHYYERTCPFTSAAQKTCDPNNRGKVITDTQGVIHVISGGGGADLKSPGNCTWLESSAGTYHFMEMEIDGNTLIGKAWNTSDGTATNPILIDEFRVVKAGAPGGDSDLNSDGRVNVMDFGILLSSWGNTSKPPADLNRDGNVNETDLGILLSNWS